MSNTIQFTDANFQSEVLDSDQPVLVDFWAAWCGPCRLVGPTIEELAHEYDGTVKVGKLNVDENPQSAGGFGINSIPAVLPKNRPASGESFAIAGHSRRFRGTAPARRRVAVGCVDLEMSGHRTSFLITRNLMVLRRHLACSRYLVPRLIPRILF